MDLKRLEELGQKLLTEKNFASVWEFFMDHFADDPAFTALGTPVPPDPALRTSLATLLQAVLGSKLVVTRLLLVRIAEYGFIHGGFMCPEGVGGVIYFERLQKGMIATPANGLVNFTRFSAKSLGTIENFEQN